MIAMGRNPLLPAGNPTDLCETIETALAAGNICQLCILLYSKAAVYSFAGAAAVCSLQCIVAVLKLYLTLL